MGSRRKDTRNNVTSFCINGCGILFFDIQAFITFCVTDIKNYIVCLMLIRVKRFTKEGKKLFFYVWRLEKQNK